MSKKVSFDFDGTLDREDVQEIVKDLLARGYEVFVTTLRYNEMQKHRWTQSPTN